MAGVKLQHQHERDAPAVLNVLKQRRDRLQLTGGGADLSGRKVQRSRPASRQCFAVVHSRLWLSLLATARLSTLSARLSRVQLNAWLKQYRTNDIKVFLEISVIEVAPD